MGGRGATSSILDSISLGGRRYSLTKWLSNQDIQRANEASFMVDMGNVIKRMFESGAKKIDKMELSNAEKKEAIRKLAELSTDALKDAAKDVNVYVSGPARLSSSQMSGKAADKALESRERIDRYVKELSKKSLANKKRNEERRLGAVLSEAEAQKKKEVSFGGKTYYRKSTRGSIWYIR